MENKQNKNIKVSGNSEKKVCNNKNIKVSYNGVKKANNNKPKKVQNKSKCIISDKCGGCQYIDVEYKEQIAKKEKQIKKLLSKYGTPENIIPMDNPLYYRNKVHAVFHHKKGNDIIAGIYEQGTHNVLNTKECFIEDKHAQAIIKTITKLIKSFKITVFNEDTEFGILRHVLIRRGHYSGQIMVVLVTSTPVFPSKKNFAKALLAEYPEITTIVQNINNKKTSLVLGDKEQTIYGKGYIEDQLCGKTFRISAKSFYQINSVQTEKLYKKAIEYAALKKTDRVIDAYCGIGTIGLAASDYVGEVIGVELNRDAVHDAIINAKLNSVKNVTFYNNDAGKFMSGLASRKENIDVVFMDPPRSGSDEEFLSSVIELKPRKIVYISCGLDTLARDLEYLTSKEYKVERIGAVDMFPMTEHVETVIALHRKDS